MIKWYDISCATLYVTILSFCNKLYCPECLRMRVDQFMVATGTALEPLPITKCYIKAQNMLNVMVITCRLRLALGDGE